MKVFITCNISKKKGWRPEINIIFFIAIVDDFTVTSNHMCVCVFVSVCSYVHMVQSLWFVAVCSLCMIYDAQFVHDVVWKRHGRYSSSKKRKNENDKTHEGLLLQLSYLSFCRLYCKLYIFHNQTTEFDNNSRRKINKQNVTCCQSIAKQYKQSTDWWI